jgi:hypothetical protein
VVRSPCPVNTPRIVRQRSTGSDGRSWPSDAELRRLAQAALNEHHRSENGAAGFATQWVGRSQRLVWIGAGVLFAYFAYNHWWSLWGVMPDWYNVLVVIPVVPLVWLGSVFARRFS